jgi:hypothetical protein
MVARHTPSGQSTPSQSPPSAPFPRSQPGSRYASGSSVLAIAFAAQARTSRPGGSGPPRQAVGAIPGASSSLFARRLPRSSNPLFVLFRLGSRSPASGITCSTIPFSSFVLPVWPAKPVCCKGCGVSIGSTSATRCAGPPTGCSFRVMAGTKLPGPAQPPTAAYWTQQGGLRRAFLRRLSKEPAPGWFRRETRETRGEAGKRRSERGGVL